MQMNKESILHMLEQIGFDSLQIQRFEDILETEGIEEARNYLRCQRCDLVEKMHLYQKKVDQLDYLIYQLKKEEL
ncbi:MAG: hypothetical protein KBT48_02645 [Firmicutes bacterium]|nr:hypothetical protein [Bacillota bacterium]